MRGNESCVKYILTNKLGNIMTQNKLILAKNSMIAIVVMLVSLTTYTANAQITKLFSFLDEPSGRTPNGSLISDGTHLYGFTYLGGVNGFGTIFKILPDGTGFEKLLDFDETNNGRGPLGTPYFDGTYLFGVTEKGGNSNFGTVFKILPDGTGFSKLKDFTGMPDGWGPKYCTLSSDGTYLFGTTVAGGTYDNGTVFRIKKDGTDYSNILNFEGATNGADPYGSVIYSDGLLYGMTEGGGENSIGTIFKIETDGSGYQKLFDFTGEESGSVPDGALYNDGTYLYGMTNLGGINNDGVIFKIKTDGSNFTKLLDFDADITGSNPLGDLTAHGGYLYGLTSGDGVLGVGTIFKLRPDGSEFTVIYDFDVVNGSHPTGSLYSDGSLLFGLTNDGGDNGRGALFSYYDLIEVQIININENIVELYPNPTTGNIFLNLHYEHINDKVQLFNMLDNIVAEWTITEASTEIDLSDFPKGIYLMKINNGNDWIFKKIILQ